LSGILVGEALFGEKKKLGAAEKGLKSMKATSREWKKHRRFKERKLS